MKKQKDNGWYDDHAVRFYDYSKAISTKKIEELKNKASELVKAKNEYFEKHSIYAFKAKYIGCVECGSKLSKRHLMGQRCPVCGNDLRSKTTIDKLAWYDEKVVEISKKIEKEREKQKKVARVMWLVKIEWHS